MAFQFLCPQGHLLQADPSQMGRTINCPTCGMLFVVPTLIIAAAVQAVQPVTPVPPPPAAEPEAKEEGPLDFPLRRRTRRRLDFLEDLSAENEAAAESPAEEKEAFDTPTADEAVESAPNLVHIACPRGHELITPMETMGQEVMCPHCGRQFTLRYDQTREYKAERRKKEEEQAEKLGKSWLIWSIVAGVLVLTMLVGMIIYSSR